MVGGDSGLLRGRYDHATRCQHLFAIFGFASAGRALLCDVEYACENLFVDRLSGVIQFRSQIFSAGFSLLLWLSFGEMVPIASAFDLGLFLALGLLGGAGVLGLVVAYRMSQPSLLAPFEYFGIPFSMFLGWWFFAEAPLDRLFPGVLAIIAGGLLIIWRQARIQTDAAS